MQCLLYWLIKSLRNIKFQYKEPKLLLFYHWLVEHHWISAFIIICTFKITPNILSLYLETNIRYGHGLSGCCFFLVRYLQCFWGCIQRWCCWFPRWCRRIHQTLVAACHWSSASGSIPHWLQNKEKMGQCTHHFTHSVWSVKKILF